MTCKTVFRRIIMTLAIKIESNDLWKSNLAYERDLSHVKMLIEKEWEGIINNMYMPGEMRRIALELKYFHPQFLASTVRDEIMKDFV